MSAVMFRLYEQTFAGIQCQRRVTDPLAAGFTLQLSTPTNPKGAPVVKTIAVTRTYATCRGCGWHCNAIQTADGRFLCGNCAKPLGKDESGDSPRRSG